MGDKKKLDEAYDYYVKRKFIIKKMTDLWIGA